MAQQIPVDGSARIESSDNSKSIEVAHDVAYKRLLFVNVVFIGMPDNWVLVDTGIAGSAPFIKRAAEDRFGEGAVPKAIILTHGHFDHVGALKTLSDSWSVPVYAHMKEVPYLDGSSSYPPPDPSVGGGMMSLLSRFYPTGPIDVSNHLRALPPDNTVPFLYSWKWIATPGHSTGHISLWRESDRLLISGDAVITTAQESAYAAATQESEIHGPPKYFTPDWIAAESSVATLAALNPKIIVPGHGRAMHGKSMENALQTLARTFKQVAVPSQGRYVIEKTDDSPPSGDGKLPLSEENISPEASNVQTTMRPGQSR